jgi:hypothetical protein
VAGSFKAGTGRTSAVFELRAATGKITKAIVSSEVDESTDFDLYLESAISDRHNEANGSHR